MRHTRICLGARPHMGYRHSGERRTQREQQPTSLTAVDLMAFLDRLATVSGEVILPYFRTSRSSIDDKSRGGAFDPVTAADRAAEQAIRAALIREQFPGHGVIGEEFGSDKADADYVLGPRSDRRHQVVHLLGMPAWGTLIALTHNGTPVLGMMHQPLRPRAILRRRRPPRATAARRASAP